MSTMVAMGTLSGKIIAIDRLTQTVVQRYDAHSKKVTQVFLTDGVNIVSSSNDATIYVYYLDKPDGTHKPHKRIDLTKHYEIMCFTPVESKPKLDIEFVVGFGTGDLVYFKETAGLLGGSTVTKATLPGEKQGSVTFVRQFKKILVWATAAQVKVSYYPQGLEKDNRKICLITKPALPKDSPFAQNLTLVPAVFFRKSTQTMHNPDPNNITMITTWCNMIKVNELLYDSATDRYRASEIAKLTIDLPDVFLSSSSFLTLNAGQDTGLISL
jgi:hypothetical protein